MKSQESAPAPKHRSTTWSRVRGGLVLFNVALLIVLVRHIRSKREPGVERVLPVLEPAGAVLTSAAAFDLAPTSNGAVLVWAPKNQSLGAVRVAAFRADGSQESPSRELVARTALAGNVEELAVLAAPRGHLALAAVERRFGTARVVAGEAAATAVIVPSEIAKTAAAAGAERGNLALSGDPMRSDSVSLLARAGDAECVDTRRRECVAFAWWRLSFDRTESRGLPLSVPKPCTSHALSLLNEPRGMHYAVCSESAGAAERSTTLFTIQNTPEYARADTVLKGCQPLGLFAADDAVWLVGDCAGKRRAARAGADNAPVEVREIASPRLECVSGRAFVHAGPVDVGLTTARAGLETVLPSALAPRGSRAVWTGAALVVAHAQRTRLELERYACEGASLRQLTAPEAPAAR
jgi:hypothetical protein